MDKVHDKIGKDITLESLHNAAIFIVEMPFALAKAWIMKNFFTDKYCFLRPTNWNHELFMSVLESICVGQKESLLQKYKELFYNLQSGTQCLPFTFEEKNNFPPEPVFTTQKTCTDSKASTPSKALTENTLFTIGSEEGKPKPIKDKDSERYTYEYDYDDDFDKLDSEVKNKPPLNDDSVIYWDIPSAISKVVRMQKITEPIGVSTLQDIALYNIITNVKKRLYCLNDLLIIVDSIIVYREYTKLNESVLYSICIDFRISEILSSQFSTISSESRREVVAAYLNINNTKLFTLASLLEYHVTHNRIFDFDIESWINKDNCADIYIWVLGTDFQHTKSTCEKLMKKMGVLELEKVWDLIPDDVRNCILEVKNEKTACDDLYVEDIMDEMDQQDHYDSSDVEQNDDDYDSSDQK
jgi:hypothetical protein